MSLAGENAAAFSRRHRPIHAPRDGTVDVYHGVSIPDPYRPLEDLNSSQTQQWAASEEARFRLFIGDTYEVEARKVELREIYEYPVEQIPMRYGNRYFSYYHDGKSPHGVFRVHDSPEGEARVLLDPNQWDAQGRISIQATFPSPDGRLVAYLTSEAGSDEGILRIRDVATGQDLADVIPGCRFTAIVWDRDSSAGFHYTYPVAEVPMRHVVKRHEVGKDVANDLLMFEAPGIPSSYALPIHLRNESGGWSRYEAMQVRSGPNKAYGLYISERGSGKPLRCLFDDNKTTLMPLGEVNGKIYAGTSQGTSRFRIVAIDPQHPESEHWQTIVPEHPTDVISHARMHQGRLLLTYNHNLSNRLEVFNLEGKHLCHAPIPPHCEISFQHSNPQDTTLYLSVSSYTEASAKYAYDLNQNTLTLWKASQCKVNLADAVVEQFYATSKDGTQIPMTVIRKPGVKLDGTAATKMRGYGGFGNSLTPGFSLGTYQWVNEGGIQVEAHIRGGGELGWDWYEQARGCNKQKSFDDFIACAEELIRRGYTSPERLAITGGSNGGLLTLASALQHPDLFGSVIAEVPVTDMLRFARHTVGNSWKSDYGDPENSQQDFEAVRRYSPLHNIAEGRKYPPILLTTADHDNRVVPSHAYKFAATFAQKADPGSLCLLNVQKDAGHGMGKSTEKALEELAQQQLFLEKTIGPISQEKYRESLKTQAVKLPDFTRWAGFKIPSSGQRIGSTVPAAVLGGV